MTARTTGARFFPLGHECAGVEAYVGSFLPLGCFCVFAISSRFILVPLVGVCRYLQHFCHTSRTLLVASMENVDQYVSSTGQSPCRTFSQNWAQFRLRSRMDDLASSTFNTPIRPN